MERDTNERVSERKIERNRVEVDRERYRGGGPKRENVRLSCSNRMLSR